MKNIILILILQHNDTIIFKFLVTLIFEKKMPFQIVIDLYLVLYSFYHLVGLYGLNGWLGVHT